MYDPWAGRQAPVRSGVIVKRRYSLLNCRRYIQGRQTNLTCAARERFGPTTISSVRK